MARRVRRPVPKGLVGLDHEDHLVRGLRQAVLLPEAAEVVQRPLEQAEYLIFDGERSAQFETKRNQSSSHRRIWGRALAPSGTRLIFPRDTKATSFAPTLAYSNEIFWNIPKKKKKMIAIMWLFRKSNGRHRHSLLYMTNRL